MQIGLGITQECNVGNVFFAKEEQEETGKQQHVIVTENNLFKILQQKVFEITTRSSPANLIVASHGILSRWKIPDR